MAEYIRVLDYIIARDRRYTDTDEWVKLEGDIAIVGITDYAQKKLRDIVGVELPDVGRSVKRGEVVASIESVKAAAEVYAPLTGEIVEVNERLYEEPELLNKEPYETWMFKIKVVDKSEYEKLMSPEEYAKHIKRREEGS
ncbi:glycine cleavage system H protein [Pyrolobus fumarii 1A]|uniref:Probable glycine cleavage system H protein n=1 Tax=Pyrolobus fumarii (strain DSM 11204 / 1A) TaxID=694429 RepID=G0EEG6_PYRF1|nr:glycine cleavage system protein GcvH [Pyrolobus fumarii]AEM38007.1 glycine cleavage system H protein [Pyrolobus fumarii 1A]